MEENIIINLKAGFINAAYGKINNSILRIAAQLISETLTFQVVMRRGYTEEHADDVRDIIGDLVGSFENIFGDSEILEVDNIEQFNGVSPLPIILFRVSDSELQKDR